jgi:hypothetical protein
MVLASFWESFFLLLIFLPLALLWGFALVDIFRRDDINGLLKAAWIACVILVPFFGTLIYMVARPPGATRDERAAIEAATQGHARDDRTSELSTLSDLHDRGKLTDGEFAQEKARILDTIDSRPITL